MSMCMACGHEHLIKNPHKGCICYRAKEFISEFDTRNWETIDHKELWQCLSETLKIYDLMIVDRKEYLDTISPSVGNKI